MLSWIIRIALGLALLALLRYVGLLDLKMLAAALARPEILAAAAGIILASIPLGAWRWWILLRGLGFTMDFRWSLRTVFITQFLNAFLPGAYGGDIARIALAYRAAKGSLSRLTFTIVVDRLSGLAGLILLGAVTLWGLPPSLRGAISLFVAAAAILLAGAIVAGLLWGKRIATLLERLPARIGGRLAHVVREVVAALQAYLGRWLLLAAVLAISVAQFALVLIVLPMLGTAMHLGSLAPTGYFVAGIWSTIANAIPLTPGGLGVGEAAFAHLAALLEPVPSGASYATVFLAMRLLIFLTSVAGIVPYLPHRIELRRYVAAVQGSGSNGPGA